MPSPSNVQRFAYYTQAPGFLLKDRRTFGIRVINKTGSAIAANKLVALSGFDVTTKHIKVVLADADAANLSTDVYVTKASISDGARATVYKGFLSTSNLDTSGATNAGDPVYLDTTAGGFTSTAPSAGNASVTVVGYVVVKSSTVGQIAWDVQPTQKYSSLQSQGGGVDSQIITASGTIASAAITGTSAGQLGHANGVILVPAGGAAVVNQLVYCFVESLFATAAYGGGGNLSVNIGAGGAALTGVAATATWCTNSASAYLEFVPLAAAAKAYTLNNPLNLVSSVAPTQPGTAAGTINWKIGYRALQTP